MAADYVNDALRKIALDHFSNETALDMGMLIIELAKRRNQHIAVEVRRLNHAVFFYIDDTLPQDKHNWMRRKANLAMHFEESSLSIKHDLLNHNMSLDKTFALDE